MHGIDEREALLLEPSAPGAETTSKRRVLIIHQDFPGQFLHVATALKDRPDVELMGIGKSTAPGLPGVQLLRYQTHRTCSAHTHAYCKKMEDAVLHGQAVLKVLTLLHKSGFVPDVVIAHPGWGETLYLRHVFPKVKLIHLCEWFHSTQGPEMDFDPEFPATLNTRLMAETWQAQQLMALQQCDIALAPTQWQRSQFPATYHPKIRVLHEGVETQHLRPSPRARLRLADGTLLQAGDPVVTYMARNLEPTRGFHQFMRSLPALLAAIPDCQVLILGGDEVRYGSPPADAPNWRAKMLRDVPVDPQRVHFMGSVSYTVYRKVLQVSAAHVYLTYPFVLSRSLLEAMACGCAVVASDTAPVREVIRHGENGLLVDFFSTEQLAKTVADVMAHPDRMQALREAAVSTVQERYGQTEGTAGYLALMGCTAWQENRL